MERCAQKNDERGGGGEQETSRGGEGETWTCGDLSPIQLSLIAVIEPSEEVHENHVINLNKLVGYMARPLRVEYPGAYYHVSSIC